MKKYIIIGFILLFENSLVAQNKKIIGDWKENYHMVRDTTMNGVNEINSNSEAYKSGFKKLSSEYIDYREIHSKDEGYDGWEISITKEKDDFLVINGPDLKVKLVYSPKTNNYYISPKKWWGIHGDLTVEYDNKNQKLLFIDEESKLTMFEFSRK